MGVSASPCVAPPVTATVDSPRRRGGRGIGSCALGVRAAIARRVEVRLHEPHDLGDGDARDVAHHHAAARHGVVDHHRREVVPARAIDPHQLAVEQEPEPGLFGVESYLWPAVLVARASGDEAHHLQRRVVDLTHRVTPSGTYVSSNRMMRRRACSVASSEAAYDGASPMAIANSSAAHRPISRSACHARRCASFTVPTRSRSPSSACMTSARSYRSSAASIASRWSSRTPRRRKYASCGGAPPSKRSNSFATTSSAQEKSRRFTCEKSITVNDGPRHADSRFSISVRTAAPVGRVTRLEYRSQTVRLSTELTSM